jgi:hypothetical protein
MRPRYPSVPDLPGLGWYVGFDSPVADFAPDDIEGRNDRLVGWLLDVERRREAGEHVPDREVALFKAELLAVVGLSLEAKAWEAAQAEIPPPDPAPTPARRLSPWSIRLRIAGLRARMAYLAALRSGLRAFLRLLLIIRGDHNAK